jgi:mRNA-degrading endonuclease RelE of RelBE toxin-antitoxin system
MRFEIVLAPVAAQAYRVLSARLRSELRDAIETHLRHEPRKTSRSRIKRLRGMRQPQFRLRVGELRVFYDVTDEAVEILAIVTKAEAQRWLGEEGTPDPDGRASEGEG